jgi:tryptophan synthase alpha chain
MNAIDRRFQKLRETGRKAFIPFVTAGDPDLEFTRLVLQQLDHSGASICEVGIPYSDPIADGPVIQASYTRALTRGVKLNQIFQTLSTVIPKVQMPIATMVSYAIVHRHGLESYLRDAQTAGVSGAIIPDLLVDESEQIARLFADADFSLIQLVTPTTPRERAVRIAQRSTGFLYYVSVTGITGERHALPDELLDSVQWLRQRTDLPICIGFGISLPEHVAQLKEVADGIIVGSAIVRRIAAADSDNRQAVLDEVGEFATSLVTALNSTD